MTSTELETKTTSTQLATTANEAIAEMMSDITLSDVELTRVSFPGAGGTTWEVDDCEPTKQLVGTVIDDYSIDTFYVDEYDGGNNPPDASWVGGAFEGANEAAIAAGIIGGPLANEPLNKYDPTRKTISNRWRIFLAVPGELFPYQIDVPAMSRKTWVNFKLKAIGGKGYKTQQVEIGLALEKAKSSGGIDYARLVPSFIRALGPDEADAAIAKAQAFLPLTRVTRAATPEAAPAADSDEIPWP